MGSDAVIQNYRVANEKWKSLSSCGHKNCDDQLDIKGQGILGGLRNEKSAAESCCLIWYWWPIAAAEEVLLGSLVRHRPPALSLLSPSRKWRECRRRRRDEEEPAKRDQSRLCSATTTTAAAAAEAGVVVAKAHVTFIRPRCPSSGSRAEKKAQVFLNVMYHHILRREEKSMELFTQLHFDTDSEHLAVIFHLASQHTKT